MTRQPWGFREADSSVCNERMRACASRRNKHPEDGEGRVEVLLRVPRFPATTLGERIRRYRMEQGLYQTRLAELAGVDEMTSVNIKSSHREPPASFAENE